MATATILTCHVCGGEGGVMVPVGPGITDAASPREESQPCPNGCIDGVPVCDRCEQRKAIINYNGVPTCLSCMADFYPHSNEVH